MSGEKWMRGLVKTVFVLCYIAFMAASIRHVATFFNAFEPGGDNIVGSYALAGAFDVTALVTTVGVMFFRKSMPRWVFGIVWGFILVLAAYSFFINWEYASHYQDMTLLSQPTGQTLAVYDTQGVLHYVPQMQVNTALLFVNPILASGFTIFALVYSVIAEFFGTKPPTAAELQARKAYLTETSVIVAEIKKLEEEAKGPGVVARLKDAAKEVVSAGKEIAESVRKDEDKEALSEPITAPKKERTTGPLSTEYGDDEDAEDEDDSDGFDTTEMRAIQPSQIERLNADIEALSKHFPKIAAWRNWRRQSILLSEVGRVTGVHHKTLKSMADKDILARQRNKPNRVLLESVVEWLLKDIQSDAKNIQSNPLTDPLNASFNDVQEQA